MPSELLQQLPSLGIAGVLFVMWWLERQERAKAETGLRDAAAQTARVVAVSEQLLAVVKSNTEALTALRIELHAQRNQTADWMERLTRALPDDARRAARALDPTLKRTGT